VNSEYLPIEDEEENLQLVDDIEDEDEEVVSLVVKTQLKAGNFC